MEVIPLEIVGSVSDFAQIWSHGLTSSVASESEGARLLSFGAFDVLGMRRAVINLSP